MASTLNDLRDALAALGDTAKAHDLIDVLAELGLITPQEELVIKTRLRALLRDRLNDIPRDDT